MNWTLREDPDALATAAARIEETTDLTAAHVEKDFWVTEVLRGIASGSMPTTRKVVTSLVADHAETAGFNADFVEADPVGLRVLAPVRALIEKLTIVHHAAKTGDPSEQARLARHYYDIWCLLNDADTRAALEESPADVLAREVSTFTQAAGLETSNRPADGFAASPAFDPKDNKPARTALETIVLRELVWPGTPQLGFPPDRGGFSYAAWAVSDSRLRCWVS